MDTVEEFLAHFGVKGMKWGVRRSQKELHPASADHTHAQSIKAKGRNSGVKALSNKDIQDYMNRLNLEKQFKSTTPGGQAKAFVSQLLVGVGKQQATSVVNTAASKAVADGMARARRK